MKRTNAVAAALVVAGALIVTGCGTGNDDCEDQPLAVEFVAAPAGKGGGGKSKPRLDKPGPGTKPRPRFDKGSRSRKPVKRYADDIDCDEQREAW
ncbi:hypothetical protein DIZ27_14545 [Streptomyces sp. NWU339]|uniref:hypothetical protein n=1 Tax=Streptomyces sp. NWU339 TaxID=2185284 RepID=UPI000D67A3F0|nr:hypothetical protein [Streptomyces sp. NWU339]PWI09752.1 hypothetical protein DIZ27_14545 [Streptomyces sp. NWU339]